MCEQLTDQRKLNFGSLIEVRNSKWNLGCGSKLLKSNKGCLHSFLSSKGPVSGD